MNEHDVKEKILNVLDNHQVGTLATVRNDRPHSRYMTFYHDGLMLYTPTGKDTHKVEDIEENPYVHLLLGYEGEGYGDRFLEVEGKAEIRDDEKTKEKLWHKRMENWFNGPDDPNYIVLQITPSFIRLMNEDENSPYVLEL
ncbi:pyridoxamine 5'-phosphate oxidase family protein [Bacillus shivajii]|uniref:pyridoxamine 5'-phosphate oxidase family protein n=1 Tax=Bacillus shivajii TaxID=1983719 RepID=UPI001CF99323|nr:pyridoxamine 5'-phosphate oxidase family protein [Bacillus shivajii]UCZ55148.1 pyridoxamine 5'-phosphate oxidase family protein [Bacillus shivajii]